jgi:hypothetical protein
VLEFSNFRVYVCDEFVTKVVGIYVVAFYVCVVMPWNFSHKFQISGFNFVMIL